MAKVSVLIPLYNSEKYIERAIKSVLQQSYKNVEIIIVNDGSTDNSLHIAKKYQSENVKVFSQPNMGACRARNVAIEKASGEFIQYLDSDDLLYYNKIESQLKLLQNYGSDNAVFCSQTRDYEAFKAGQYIKKTTNRSYDNPADLFVDIFNAKGDVLLHSWLIPRHLIGKTDLWNEKLVKGQDAEFFIRVVMKSKGVLFDDNTTVYYRPTGPSSISAALNNDAVRSIVLSLESIQNTILKYENSNRVKDALARLFSQHYCYNYNLHNAKILMRLEKNILNLGRSVTYIGNPKIKILSNIIGLKMALIIKQSLKKTYKYP